MGLLQVLNFYKLVNLGPTHPRKKNKKGPKKSRITSLCLFLRNKHKLWAKKDLTNKFILINSHIMQITNRKDKQNGKNTNEYRVKKQTL